MSPSQPAVVADAEVEAAARTLYQRNDAEKWQAFIPDAKAALKAAAAVRSDDVTTRLTEAADRVAKAEERAEKAEAELVGLRKAAQAVVDAWDWSFDIVNAANALRAVLAQGEKL